MLIFSKFPLATTVGEIIEGTIVQLASRHRCSILVKVFSVFCVTAKEVPFAPVSSHLWIR